MRKELIRWIIYLLLYVPLGIIYITKPPTETEYVQPAEIIEEEGSLIRWKQEDMYEEELLEVYVEELEVFKWQ